MPAWTVCPSVGEYHKGSGPLGTHVVKSCVMLRSATRVELSSSTRNVGTSRETTQRSATPGTVVTTAGRNTPGLVFPECTQSPVIGTSPTGCNYFAGWNNDEFVTTFGWQD